MPTIFIKCPTTGNDVDTGFVVDNISNNIFSNNKVNCPYCKNTHAWSNDDAYFID